MSDNKNTKAKKIEKSEKVEKTEIKVDKQNARKMQDQIIEIMGSLPEQYLDKSINVSFDDLDEIEDLLNTKSEDPKVSKLISGLSSILFTLNKIKDEIVSQKMDLDARENVLTEHEVEVDAKLKTLQQQHESVVGEMRNYRKEDEKLRGLSKVDKILFLIEELKDSIIVENILEKKVYQMNKFVKLNMTSKKVLRYFGDYEIYVLDAKSCQAKINLILKYLTLLISTAKGKMGQFEERSYYKARGILKALHFRINFVDNHVSSHESKPIEILRIFSALEPTITSLSALDDEATDTEEYDKVVKSFNTFITDEKVEFMKVHFNDEYIEKLDQKTQTNAFVRLLNRLVLNPTQVLDQLGRWEKVNASFRKKFIELLAVELTPTEKVSVSQSEIENMRQKGLI